jgi:receptor-type tyrosine-protein phosphatase gamma
MLSGLKMCNASKNRNTLVPLENSRVHLTPKPGVEGSDYINASWLHGFRKLRDFIVTQHPLADSMKDTIKDFWQMVWDHSVQSVVLLSSLDEEVNCLFTCCFFPLLEYSINVCFTVLAC